MPLASKTQPSIQDVAKLAGVSLGTVSNVLNHPERVRDSTVKKVLRAISQLGFVRNDAARQLKAGNSKALGLLVLDSANPFFASLARGAEDCAHEHGYQVLIGSSSSSQEREESYLRMFQEQRLSGVLLSPTGDPIHQISQLRSVGVRAVIVDRQSDDQLCCSVSVDDVFGGRLAVSHLLESGRTAIGFVGASLEIKQVADRFLGAQEAMAKNARATLERYEAKSMEVISGREIGLEILKLNPDKRPTALFAANDLLAVGLLQAFALQNSIKVPAEIAIIGYDDIAFSQATVVPLTSIRQPAELIGCTAVELLLDELENPNTHKHKQVTFQPELVIRDSTHLTTINQ